MNQAQTLPLSELGTPASSTSLRTFFGAGPGGSGAEMMDNYGVSGVMIVDSPISVPPRGGLQPRTSIGISLASDRRP